MDKKIVIILGIFTTVIFIAGIFLVSQNPKEVQSKVYDQTQVQGEIRHQKGPENAKVTIVEFADFQCPACATAFPYISDILKKYPNDVRLIYRHFPLSQHKNAVKAAQVSEAAGEQGKFWEMYQILYTKQNEWAEDKDPSAKFLSYAKELGLNEEQFKTAIKEDKFKSLIDTDSSDGFKVDVNATPTFYINNKKSVSGYDNLENEIVFIIKG